MKDGHRLDLFNSCCAMFSLMFHALFKVTTLDFRAIDPQNGFCKDFCVSEFFVLQQVQI